MIRIHYTSRLTPMNQTDQINQIDQTDEICQMWRPDPLTRCQMWRPDPLTRLDPIYLDAVDLSSFPIKVVFAVLGGDPTINCIQIESSFSIPHGESVKSSIRSIGSNRYKIVSHEFFI